LYELLVGLEVQRVDLELRGTVDLKANPGASPRVVHLLVVRLEAMAEAGLHRVMVAAAERADLHRVMVAAAARADHLRVTVEAAERADHLRVTVEAAVHRAEHRGELGALVA
jgi:hypothetical protein